jgi:hypothetical protein
VGGYFLSNALFWGANFGIYGCYCIKEDFIDEHTLSTVSLTLEQLDEGVAYFSNLNSSSYSDSEIAGFRNK